VQALPVQHNNENNALQKTTRCKDIIVSTTRCQHVLAKAIDRHEFASRRSAKKAMLSDRL
jgi:hypothetical protein